VPGEVPRARSLAWRFFCESIGLMSPCPKLGINFSDCGSLIVRGYETVVFEMVALGFGEHVTVTDGFEEARTSFALPVVKVIVPFDCAVHVPIVIGDCGRKKTAPMFFCSVTGPYEIGGLAAFTVVGLASVELTSSTVAFIVTAVMPIPISLLTIDAGIVTLA
jgi:hypothetical protein